MTDQQLQRLKQDQTAEYAAKFDQVRKEYKETLMPSDFPGTLSLVFDLDVRVCVVTMTNDTIIGELSSFDTFGNVILSKARNRNAGPTGVNDVSLGICYLRSEQIMMIGQIDKEAERNLYRPIDPTIADNDNNDAGF